MKKLALVVFILLFAAGLLWLFLRNNIHTVIPHKLYRSAQLSPGSMDYLLQREGIKSVVNLRGKPADPEGYLNNIEYKLKLTAKYGLKSHDEAYNPYQSIVAYKVYYDAKLRGGKAADLVNREWLKSIVNLSIEPTDWYESEVEVIKKNHVQLYDLGLSAYAPISASNLAKLVVILQTAPQPILVHCSGGSDRTGLSSALFLIMNKNTDLKQAQQQFSWRYLVIHKDTTGRLTMPYYQAWLQREQVADNKTNLLRWVHQLVPLVNYPCTEWDECDDWISKHYLRAKGQQYLAAQRKLHPPKSEIQQYLYGYIPD